ncbi:MAG: hypothetical protein QOF11_1311 [Chloroflexota bacterium]|nr:hypothetical protein [Chloroflexota bacterium]
MPGAGRSGTHEDRVTLDDDQPMTSSADGIMPERPDRASERPLRDAEQPAGEGTPAPDASAIEEKALQDTVQRDHPLT